MARVTVADDLSDVFVGGKACVCSCVFGVILVICRYL